MSQARSRSPECDYRVASARVEQLTFPRRGRFVEAVLRKRPCPAGRVEEFPPSRCWQHRRHARGEAIRVSPRVCYVLRPRTVTALFARWDDGVKAVELVGRCETRSVPRRVVPSEPQLKLATSVTPAFDVTPEGGGATWLTKPSRLLNRR